jgi:Tfp pilus assembly protein PilF
MNYRPKTFCFSAHLVWILLVISQIGCSEEQTLPQTEPNASSHNSSDQLPAELAPAMAMIEQGQLDRARLRLQRHLQDQPDDGYALFLFGLTFHVLHRYDQARVHFERAVQLVPNYAPLHHFYGWCLFYLSQLDEASAAFEQHLTLQPDEPDSHYALGLIAMQQDRLDAAKDQFQTAITLHGDQPRRPHDLGQAHGKLGEAFARDGQLPQAKEHLNRATELYPDDHESLYQLYRVLLRLGEDEAAEDARQRYQQARDRAGLPAPPDPDQS